MITAMEIMFFFISVFFHTSFISVEGSYKHRENVVISHHILGTGKNPFSFFVHDFQGK